MRLTPALATFVVAFLTATHAAPLHEGTWQSIYARGGSAPSSSSGPARPPPIVARPPATDAQPPPAVAQPAPRKRISTKGMKYQTVGESPAAAAARIAHNERITGLPMTDEARRRRLSESIKQSKITRTVREDEEDAKDPTGKAAADRKAQREARAKAEKERLRLKQERRTEQARLKRTEQARLQRTEQARLQSTEQARLQRTLNRFEPIKNVQILNPATL